MLTSDGEATTPGARRGARDALILLVKAAVTVACFWYIFRQIQIDRLVRSAMEVQIGWMILAMLAVSIQLLLVALRWSAVVDALAEGDRRVSVVTMAVITTAGAFFGQVLPYFAGDAARAWLLVQHGQDWRTGVLSVVIDRAVGVGMLCALAFGILLLPAAATSLGDAHRAIALQVFGAMLALGVAGLLFAPRLAPRLERWRGTRWISIVAVAAHHAIIGSRRAGLVLSLSLTIHALSMVGIWALARAQGLSLQPIDVAILFIVMIAIAIFPFSLGGWGVREVAVVSFLGGHGVPAEQALFLSVSSGVILILVTMPGAILWFFIRPAARQSSHTRMSV